MATERESRALLRRLADEQTRRALTGGELRRIAAAYRVLGDEAKAVEAEKCAAAADAESQAGRCTRRCPACGAETDARQATCGSCGANMDLLVRGSVQARLVAGQAQGICGRCNGGLPTPWPETCPHCQWDFVGDASDRAAPPASRRLCVVCASQMLSTDQVCTKCGAVPDWLELGTVQAGSRRDGKAVGRCAACEAKLPVPWPSTCPQCAQDFSLTAPIVPRHGAATLVDCTDERCDRLIPAGSVTCPYCGVVQGKRMASSVDIAADSAALLATASQLVFPVVWIETAVELLPLLLISFGSWLMGGGDGAAGRFVLAALLISAIRFAAVKSILGRPPHRLAGVRRHYAALVSLCSIHVLLWAAIAIGFLLLTVVQVVLRVVIDLGLLPFGDNGASGAGLLCLFATACGVGVGSRWLELQRRLTSAIDR